MVGALRMIITLCMKEWKRMFFCHLIPDPIRISLRVHEYIINPTVYPSTHRLYVQR